MNLPEQYYDGPEPSVPPTPLSVDVVLLHLFLVSHKCWEASFPSTQVNSSSPESFFLSWKKLLLFSKNKLIYFAVLMTDIGLQYPHTCPPKNIAVSE